MKELRLSKAATWEEVTLESLGRKEATPTVETLQQRAVRAGAVEPHGPDATAAALI